MASTISIGGESRVHIPYHLEQIMKRQMVPSEKPNEFRIIGRSGLEIDVYTSAVSVFETLSEWAGQEGYPVILKQDKYKEIYIEELKKMRIRKNPHSKSLLELQLCRKVEKNGYLLIELAPLHAKIIQKKLKGSC